MKKRGAEPTQKNDLARAGIKQGLNPKSLTSRKKIKKMGQNILNVSVIESNGTANIFVTNTSQTDYAFVAEISVTVNGTWTRYFYDDFTVGGRMIPPGVGQSKLNVSVPEGAKCTAQVHYWMADMVANGSN